MQYNENWRFTDANTTNSERKNKMPSRAYLAKRFGPKITDAEFKLRRALEKSGLHFITQEYIKTANGCFLVDFLVEGSLVVEVRGSSHFGKAGRRKDAWKTRELVNAGYSVLWFENIEVYKKIREVVAKIKQNV